MADNAGTLERIARHVGLALQPLAEQLESGNVIELFAELGLQFPPQLLQPAFTNALNNGVTAAAALPGLVTQLSDSVEAGDDLATIAAGVALIQQINTTVTSLSQVRTELQNIAGSLPGMNATEVTNFAQSLPSRLLGHSLISYLEEVEPSVVGAGNLFGFLDYIPNAGVAGDPTHPPFTTRQLQFSRFGEMLKSPANLLRTLYGWDAPGFDGTVLIQRLNTSLDLLGIPSEVKTPTSLETPLFTLQATPPGLSALVTGEFLSDFDLAFPLSNTWALEIHMRGAFAAGTGATITPPAKVSIIPPSGTLTGEHETNLVAKGTDAAHPFIVFGQTNGSRLQADTFKFGIKTSVTFDSGAGSDFDAQFQLQVTGGKAVIDMTNADGFLATVLSGFRVEAGFNFNATWRPDTGIHIEGGAQLELALPLHLTLGPVKLPTLYLVAGASNTGLPLEISVALGITLGPIQATVDHIGLKALLSFPENGGNLGPADLAIGFKPPSGLGILIDAGAVAGGGYIGFHPEQGRYEGVLDVALAEIIQVKVIAVLDTKLPDGSRGYSLLLIITFNFPPIQLGFGFTLTGVGGLIGVNRTMSIDALRAGQRAHALDSVLFPPDPVANAPAIISNIRNFFPPAQGRYVFGPMLELGWGTPTLIRLAVGVMLEVPDPVRIALLGLIHSGLPSEDAALIELHIDVLGTLDFATKTIEINGSLFDSRVLIYSLAGDLLFRLSWGENPALIFSLGGFHPHFNTAGLNLPPMRRLSVSIGDGDNPRISSNSYFAITSNTLQFGANVEAHASAGGFSIHGYLGFDVLFIRSPFSFEFDFAASFAVKYKGTSLASLHVDGEFTGPRPWHLHARARIHFVFFSVGVSLTKTWGESTPAILPVRSVLPDLLPALGDPRNWSAALPEGATQAVSLATPKPNEHILRVHPMGTLSVRESVVPLDLPITRYGGGAPSDGDLFSISAVEINLHAEASAPFQDYFAAGQFLTLSDADKLSLPSYELYNAGVKIGSSSVITGADSPRTVVYEERYIDVPGGLSRFARRYVMKADIHTALAHQGAGYLSAAKNSGLAKYRNGATVNPVTTADPRYVVAGVDDLAIRSDVAASEGVTYFHARAALAAHLAAHPGDAANLQIVPLHEVTA